MMRLDNKGKILLTTFFVFGKILILSSTELLTPNYNPVRRESLLSFRNNISYLNQEQPQGCGILYVLSSLNGSTTDYGALTRKGGGEGKFRLLTVIFEAFTSASRVLHSLALNSILPEFCQQSRPKITLFVDRDIISNLKEYHLLTHANCIFDNIVYFDMLPTMDAILNIRKHKTKDMLSRIPPRPNAMKLIALFSSPYKYTLYLDGDTAPCLQFQQRVFETLRLFDILATKNPFPHESTGGAKTYKNSPNHKAFSHFSEINGGVFAYRRRKLPKTGVPSSSTTTTTEPTTMF